MERIFTATDATLQQQGHALLEAFLPAESLKAAQLALTDIYPNAATFHANPHSPVAEPFLNDEFAGIRTFPFSTLELNLLAVHPRLVALAEHLLGSEDIRLYSAESWAKYTGAASYEQHLHRDYLNHSLLVPPLAGSRRDQIEMFLYLSDVPESLGPPHFVSNSRTGNPPALPNWIPRDEQPEWYQSEQSAAGPAGTVVVWELGTFHRGTELTRPLGSRYTLHLCYRRAEAEWIGRNAWANRSHEAGWYDFVARASVRQLLLFGFPPPGHSFWCAETLENMATRYPGLDLTPFRNPDTG